MVLKADRPTLAMLPRRVGVAALHAELAGR